MQEIFEQFDSVLLNEISQFYNSGDDILLLYGASGCGKSNLVRRSLETLDENFLTFHHNCFEFGTIDDFLLNFYDSFRNYSMSQNVVLKKTVTDHFSNKIINYFKDINHNSLITVDNFELIIQKKEIVDFLLHIASFQNVKLVLISSEPYKIPPEQTAVKLREIKIKTNSLEDFSEKIRFFLPFSSKSDIETFFKATLGSELYLRLSIKYLTATGVIFSDFVGEFEKKRVNFENFLINKIISIIPENYHRIIKEFSLLHHCCTNEFLNEYSIADNDEIEFLIQKTVLTKTSQGVYLKGYLRSFFYNISIQERITMFKRLIGIYEKELSKSPKDRLLRLSRESIRNLIDNFNKNADQNSNRNFSYVAQAQTNMVNWNKIPAEKEKITEVEQAPKQFSALDYFKQAEEFENVYNYQNAVDCLIQAKFLNKNESLNVKILSKLSVNYLKINNFDSAINCEIKLFDIYKNTNVEKANSSLYKVGLIYKNLFNYTKAIEYFDKILQKPKNISLYTHVKTLLAYGEIEEQENNTKNAFEKYNKIIEMLKDNEQTDKKIMSILCEALYKIAQIYDAEHNSDLAKEYYQKNIKTSQNYQINKHLGLSYLNLADIYFDEQDIKTALEDYNEAIFIFEKTKNFEELYFICKKLAQNFEYSDSDLRFDYLSRAYNLAVALKDNFKLAYCLVEIGDYYYFIKQDREALFNYLKANEIIGNSASDDNIAKINSRIEDMKVKMNDEDFENAIWEFNQGR